MLFLQPNHLGFVIAGANLRAAVFGLKGDRDPAVFKAALAAVAVPEFKPRAGIKIETDEKRAAENADGAAPGR
jgi:ubiquitin-activating enzyme E1